MADKQKNEDSIGELIKTVVYALLIAGVVRTLFFQPFWIPSGSMKNTLLIGDFMFVNKMAYGYSRHSCPFSPLFYTCYQEGLPHWPAPLVRCKPCCQEVEKNEVQKEFRV